MAVRAVMIASFVASASCSTVMLRDVKPFFFSVAAMSSASLTHPFSQLLCGQRLELVDPHAQGLLVMTRPLLGMAWLVLAAG